MIKDKPRKGPLYQAPAERTEYWMGLSWRLILLLVFAILLILAGNYLGNGLLMK